MYHLYILYSVCLNKFYVGHTGDSLDERLRRHNTNHKGYTGGYGDWEIKYVERYATKELAYLREREIKARESRKNIEVLISSAGLGHPDP